MFNRNTIPIFPWLLVVYWILLPAVAFGQPSARELVFLNWSEYMDPDLIRRFEKQYQAKVAGNGWQRL